MASIKLFQFSDAPKNLFVDTNTDRMYKNIYTCFKIVLKQFLGKIVQKQPLWSKSSSFNSVTHQRIYLQIQIRMGNLKIYKYMFQNSFRIVFLTIQFKNSLNGLNQALPIQLSAKKFICRYRYRQDIQKYLYKFQNSFKIILQRKQFKNSLYGLNQALSIQLRSKEFISRFGFKLKYIIYDFSRIPCKLL